MATPQNYYDILQISSDATTQDIKQAFRRLARQYHPDLHPHDPQAQSKFQQLVAAYEVLVDPDRRCEYDQGLAGGPSPNPQEFYSRGIKKASGRDYQGAIADFSAAIGLKADFAEAYLKRAAARYLVRDDLGVLKDCQQVLRLQPNWGQAYYYLGRARYRLGYTQAAIDAYTHALSMEGDHGHAYYQRGIAHQDLRQLSQALADWRAAGQLFQAQGDWKNYHVMVEAVAQLGDRHWQSRSRSQNLPQLLTAGQTLLGFSLKGGWQVLTNPTRALLPIFEGLNSQQQLGVGLIWALMASLGIITGLRTFLWQILGPLGELGFRLMIAGVVPFVSLTGVSAIARSLHQAQGNWRGDVFLAGATLLPLGLLAGLAGVQSWEFFWMGAAFLGCYGILILYSACTQIARLPEGIAAFWVPVHLLVGGWLTYLALVTPVL